MLKSDVWSSVDGVTWVEATASAVFSQRIKPSNEVFNSKMWIVGGQDGGGDLNDVWHSP